MGAVLLITKTPLVRRLATDELERLDASGVLPTQRLVEAEIRQEETLAAVRAALAGSIVRERRVDQVAASDADGVELVVTVGGDGTVFTANTLPTDAPYLTVNSDPERSVGHFTRFTAATVAAGVAAWRAGTLAVEALPRLAIRVAGTEHRILNDCLFAHSNPAVLCRYVLEVDGQREYQRSSGVWISTAAGSTAAIHSAGSDPVPGNPPALLYRVREPYQSRGCATRLHDAQLPPRGLRLVPSIPGMALYLDGPNVTVAVAPGIPVDIAAADRPLRLLAPR